MTQLTPYVSFTGDCKEAMEFYQSCLGGKLDLQKVGDSPMAKSMPGKEEWVMHAMLTSGEIVLMGSDLMQDVELVKGNNVTLTINGGPKKELEEFFAKLSEGGKVTHALEAAFFGTYGDLTDKFGVHWAFQSDEK